MNAGTKLCCLIGSPVGHSLSPLIHNTLAGMMGINMAYTAFCVAPDDVGDAVRGALAMNFGGLNVTVPHKCTVMKYLIEIDPLALDIGAVTTLVPSEHGFKGYNTDITGLKRELLEENIEIKGQSVIILGAGGASNAITYLCAQMGAEHIWLLNRSVGKAQVLAGRVNEKFGNIVEPMAPDDYRNIPKGKYPVIQTTSVGLFPNTDAAPIEDDDFYELVSAGVDIIFNPAETAFMKKCRNAGAPAYNGLKMLLYQGIAAFELWNHVTVPQEMADEVLKMLQKELGY